MDTAAAIFLWATLCLNDAPPPGGCHEIIIPASPTADAYQTVEACTKFAVGRILALRSALGDAPRARITGARCGPKSSAPPPGEDT